MNILDKIKTRYRDRMLKWEEKTPNRVYIDIDPADVADAGNYLFNQLHLRFIITSGVDARDGIELLYHFSDDKSGTIITFRALLKDKEHPRIDSLAPVIKGAEWIEREVHELIGVDFAGHPGLTHLLLGEDWPKGEYPLRRKEEQ